MKTAFYSLPLLVAVLTCLPGCSQDSAEAENLEALPPREAYTKFWHQTDAEFADAETSPLEAGDIADFDTVPRFAYDPKYRVEARWEALHREKPMTFETTGTRKQRYQRVGILHFVIDSTEVNLSAYRNMELMRNQTYRNRLFVPFTDDTNGLSTYGGGRYLELEVPSSERTIVDFNRAYNPYCAYSHGYSCPIPPRENHLTVPIRAGARTE